MAPVRAGLGCVAVVEVPEQVKHHSASATQKTETCYPKSPREIERGELIMGGEIAKRGVRLVDHTSCSGLMNLGTFLALLVLRLRRFSMLQVLLSSGYSWQIVGRQRLRRKIKVLACVTILST